MKKDAYYFPHDSNAKDDPKCVMLIEQLGLEGYGIFWVLIEILRDQPEYKYPVNLLPSIARKYNTTVEKVKTVVNGYGLFQVDEFDFFSFAFYKRMEIIDGKREQARKAIQTRWNKQKQLPLPTKYDSNTDVYSDVIQGKESKEKKSKENESKKIYGEFKNVLLTKQEYDKLQKEFHNADELIKNMDEAIELKGYKYKSHYLAIKKWEQKNKNNALPQTKAPVVKINAHMELPDPNLFF